MRLERNWIEMPTQRQREIWPDRPVPKDDSEERRQRRRGKILGACILAAFIVVLVLVGRPLVKLAASPEQLEQYIESKGIWGVWVFMGLVIMQIFAAVIPGGPFEIAAGFLYGPLRGALICDAAMTIGSTLVFLLSRKFGLKFVRLYLTDEQIRSVKFLHSDGKSTALVFLMFVVPGTPKDILSYMIGLTDIKLPTWIFITAVGRFPAIVLSTLGGGALESGNIGLFILMLLIIGALSVVGIWYYRKCNGDKPLREDIREYIEKFRAKVQKK